MVAGWAEQKLGGALDASVAAPVYVIDKQISQQGLRALYAAADAFVLPSR